MGEAGKILCLEPISETTILGYFLINTWQTVDLMDEIAHPAIKFQLDTFHHQMNHGDVLGMITDLLSLIRHMQIAGVPDCHEPDAGDLDYRAILSHLDALEYKWWICCEYSHKAGTKEGLS